MAGRVRMTWPNYLRRTLVVDGVEHRLTPKLIDLALLLLLRRGAFVPIPDVIEALWPNPDEEPDFSEDVIRTYVSRLRRVLPPDSIIARSTTCTDRMEAGHYLPGALMLVHERAIARWFLDEDLPELPLRQPRSAQIRIRLSPDPRQLEFRFGGPMPERPRPLSAKPLGKQLPARKRCKAKLSRRRPTTRRDGPFAIAAE